MAESDSDAALYEYDAPSQVVDLKELQNAEGDDRWFGRFPFFFRRSSFVPQVIAGHCFNGACVRACAARVGPRGAPQNTRRTVYV